MLNHESESHKMPTSLPPWITALDEQNREVQSRIFYIKFAALCASPSGTLPKLSLRLGRNPNFLAHVIAPGRKPAPALLSYEDAIRIETMLGRDILPREFLRPDIFLVPESS